MLREWTRRVADNGSKTLLTVRIEVKWTAETWTWMLLVCGMILRLLEYSDNRQLYKDEASLFRNLVNLRVFDFNTTLTESQLAAPGFLVVERLMVRLPFHPIWAGRLIPFLFSIVSLLLMRDVARRYLSPRAVPIAVGLFALDDWLLYYAAELKQYSSDVALTLVALLLAARPAEITRRGLIVWTVFGVVGVWFSHSLALVLASVGTYLITRAAHRRQWKLALCLLGVGAVWAASFAICYFVSHRILSKDRFIWDWWNFAFLPIPPRSLGDCERIFWQVVNIFNNPSWVVTPLGVLPSALLALGLFSIGALALGLHWRGGAYLLIAPLVFTLVASGLHQYPFHGRLLIFLVPSVHLLVGEGAASLTQRGGAVLTSALGLFLLVQPAADVLGHRWMQPRLHTFYDSHGDLLPDLLDYLEKRDAQARSPQ